ncbi:MAG: hypothetical protein SFU27_13945 [Thermonemataceae bacterium]|nr:hypothetical protein [Thermonemataceae bacterium]
MRSFLPLLFLVILNDAFGQTEDTLFIQVSEREMSVSHNIKLSAYDISSNNTNLPTIKGAVFYLYQVKSTHLQFYFNNADSSLIREMNIKQIKTKIKTQKQIDNILHQKEEKIRIERLKKMSKMTERDQMIYSMTIENDYQLDKLIREYFVSFNIYLVVVNDNQKVKIIPVKHLPDKLK